MIERQTGGQRGAPEQKHSKGHPSRMDVIPHARLPTATASRGPHLSKEDQGRSFTVGTPSQLPLSQGVQVPINGSKSAGGMSPGRNVLGRALSFWDLLPTRRPGATMRRVSDKSQLRRSSRKTRPVRFKSAKVAKDKESLSEKLLGPGRAQGEVMCCGPWDWKGMLGEDWGWESTDFGESWCISAGLGG